MALPHTNPKEKCLSSYRTTLTVFFFDGKCQQHFKFGSVYGDARHIDFEMNIKPTTYRILNSDR